MSKKILLGITGSIAASKSENLHSLFSVNNETVVFSTDEGLKYISEEFQNKNDIFHSWDQLGKIIKKAVSFEELNDHSFVNESKKNSLFIKHF